jgi:hypothetical protein
MNKLAFGCSHTYGRGVERDEAWPYLLGAKNYGVPGCSSDLIARTCPAIIAQHLPATVYILWPDWTRFEYTDNGRIMQSLVTDRNRIKFMETATDEWLQENFNTQVAKVKQYCNSVNVKLIDITLYDLITYIDHADQWPLSKLGHHYSPVWHTWVADIFKKLEYEQT